MAAPSSSSSSTPQDFLTSLPRHLPTPPFIHVAGIANFRDCGGYECAPPPDADLTIGARYMVRRGVLFRCAHPTNLTPAGARTLRDELGITDFFDLRSLPEIEKLAAAAAASKEEEEEDKKEKASNKSTTTTTTTTTTTEADPPLDTSQGFVVIPGISRTFTPVYAQEDYSPVALARKTQWYTTANGQGKDYSEGFVNAYRDIATYAARGGAYATILRQLLRTVQHEQQQQQRQQQRKGNSSGKKSRPTSLLATLDGIEEWKRYADGDGDDDDDDDDDDGNSNNNKNNNNHNGNTDNTKNDTEILTSSTTTANRYYANSKRDGGVVFHCTAGKDRTGVLAAIILRLCGVPDPVIQWEYAITEPGLGDWRKVFIDHISRRGLGGGGARDVRKGQQQQQQQQKQDDQQQQQQEQQQPQRNAISRAEAARICGSRASNIRAWMEKVLDGEFGGVDRYLTEMVGLSAREVEGLRKGLAVEVAQDSDIVQPVEIAGWTVEKGMLEDNE